MTAPAVLYTNAHAAFPAVAAVAYASAVGMAAMNVVTAGNPTDQTQIDKAGTVNNLYVRYTTNTHADIGTWAFVKNGSATALSISVPSSAVGIFSNLTNSATVAVGDSCSFQYTQGAGSSGRPTVQTCCATFTPSSGTTHILSAMNDGGSNYGTTAARFINIVGPLISAVSTTEASVQAASAIAGTLHGFNVRITSNTWTGAGTAALRINGINGLQSVTIPAATTGLFADITNPDVIAAGDLLSVRLTEVGAGAFLIVSASVSMDATTDRESNLLSYGGSAIGTGTKFVPVMGTHIVGTSESLTQDVVGVAGTIDKIGCNVLTNASTSDTLVNFRKNGANGTGNFTIPASTTGNFQDLVTAGDTVIAADLICYQYSGHNGTVTSRYAFARLVTAASGGTVYNVGMAETFTAADSQATTAILPSAVNDNASATDTASNNAVLPSARADTLTAVDTQATTATLPSAAADTITMADAPSNVAVLPSAIVESAPITDQEQTNGPQAVTIAETITLTDQFNAQLVANQTIAESAPVTSAQSAVVILNLSLAEAASLSDTVAAQLAAFVSMQEAASAQDLSAAQLIANIAVQEALAFQDAVAQAGSVLTAPKCNILAGAPRTRTLTGAPRVRLLHGGCC